MAKRLDAKALKGAFARGKTKRNLDFLVPEKDAAPERAADSRSAVSMRPKLIGKRGVPWLSGWSPRRAVSSPTTFARDSLRRIEFIRNPLFSAD